MAKTYSIAPSPKWYFADAEGRPAAGGKLFTFSSLDPSTPKFVYASPNNTLPYNNPIILDASGGTPVPIYWEKDDVDASDLYLVRVEDADGNIIFSTTDFPIEGGGGGATPINQFTDIENYVINGQFNIIDADTTAASEVNPVPVGQTRMAGASGFWKDSNGNYVETLGGAITGWQFSKAGGANIPDLIKFEDVSTLGVGPPTSPSANASRFFSYTANGAGDPVTELDLVLTIPYVETFSGEELTITFDAKGSLGSNSNVIVQQNFGTGGAPSMNVKTPANFVFPTVWDRISVIITVPSIGGKNIGTDGNDSFQLLIQMPFNTIGTFSITNVQIQIGNFGLAPFIYQTYPQTQYKTFIDIINNVSKVFSTGDTKLSISSTAANGWIVVLDDNQTIGDPSSGATFAGIEERELYILIYITYNDTLAPVVGGRTGTGTTPAEALTDFNANKPMRFPQWMGRVLAPQGIGIGLPPLGIGFIEGERAHTLTIPEIPSHTHLSQNSAVEVQGGSGANLNDNGGPQTIATSATGGGQPHNNVQPTAYLYLHIKL